MILSNRTIRTVIIPSAGKGTRMLPVTRAAAKELLPVYDRPVMQLAVEEAIAAGAERIIIVISKEKASIRKFVSDALNADDAMNASGGAMPEIVYVTQDEPQGLGHAVLCCNGLTLPGPFAVILPDDVILGRSCLPEMVASYAGGHMIAAMDVAQKDVSKYGIFVVRGSSEGTSVSAVGMVEKPPLDRAPSSLAAVGRYILSPMIFEILSHTPKGAGAELQLTDAIEVASRSVALTAFRFSGARYDCGNLDGLLAASNARQAAVKACNVAATFTHKRPASLSGTAARANGPDCAEQGARRAS